MTSLRNLQRAWLVASVVIILIVVALRDSFAAMLQIWVEIETFNHCLLIAPVSIGLIWRKRSELMVIQPAMSRAGLVAVAFMAGLWAFGTAAHVAVVQHFAAVGLIPLSLWAVLGSRVAQTILFPLAYLVFLVPFGGFLIPPLMDFTADMTVAAVRLSGVAVYHDGLYFEIPNGSFKIIEACSGIRMLMAAVAVGALFAYLNFRSWRRRALFLAGVAVLAVIANWVRAYFVVMGAHFIGIGLVADHIWLGYVVFAVVIAIMLWAGSRFTDVGADAEDSSRSVASVRPAVAGNFGGILLAAIAVVGIVVSAPWFASSVTQRAVQSINPLVASLPSGHVRWSGPGALPGDWSPEFLGDTTTRAGRYVGSTAAVDMHIITYRTLSPQSELINETNKIFDATRWMLIDETTGSIASSADKPLAYIETEIRGPNGISRLVRHWYIVGGRTYRSRVAVKLIELGNTLAGRPTPAGVIAVSTQFGDDSMQARRILDAFMADTIQ